MEKTYNDILNETADLFASQGVSIIGQGYAEIATNPSLLESYIESLCEGVSADHAASMSQIMMNSNTSMLQESSITGIAPIASLSMPVIRKLWPKFVLKEALKEEVAKTPAFVVSYTKPYMFKATADGAEDRVYLPRGMKASNLLRDELRSGKFESEEVSLTSAAAATTVDVSAKLKVNTGSAVKTQPIDGFWISKITFEGDDHKPADVVRKISSDLSKSIFVELPLTDDDGKVQVVARLTDARAGKVFVGVMGLDDTKATTAKITFGFNMSSEYNETGWSVGFDIGRMDVAVGTGEHLNAPLPIEAINDMMALYQIDGTKKTVELMTDILSQRLDLEVLEFLSDSYFDQPADYPANQDGVYSTAAEMTYTFDVRPAPGFAGSPKQWREELKPMIDHLAQRIRNNTYFTNGIFNIVCNPLDAQLIENIDWSFRGGQGANMDGVAVDYSLGTFVGANTYRVIASQNVPAGEMFVVFIPSNDDQMTFKYYPYSFNIEHGYIDNNRSHTPSIMMTKRQALKAFTPAIGNINIVNNNGVGQFNQYVATKAVTGTDWGNGDDTDIPTNTVSRL